MRVLTYNIHGWQGADGRVDIDRLARIMRASGANLIGLNEVFHPFMPLGASRPALDLLADALGMQAAFGAALTPQLAFAPASPYGNALLTSYPLLAHASHHLTPVAGHEQRGLLEARLLAPASASARQRSLSVYVTHLDHRSEQVRYKQLAALLQWTERDRSRPHLLLGDLNALAPADYEDRPQAHAALGDDEETTHWVRDGFLVLPRLLRAGYVDPGSAAPTFPADDPRVRIDYILASAPLAPALRACRPWQTADTALASDHLPVLAEFDL